MPENNSIDDDPILVTLDDLKKEIRQVLKSNDIYKQKSNDAVNKLKDQKETDAKIYEEFLRFFAQVYTESYNGSSISSVWFRDELAKLKKKLSQGGILLEYPEIGNFGVPSRYMQYNCESGSRMGKVQSVYKFGLQASDIEIKGICTCEKFGEIHPAIQESPDDSTNNQQKCELKNTSEEWLTKELKNQSLVPIRYTSKTTEESKVEELKKNQKNLDTAEIISNGDYEKQDNFESPEYFKLISEDISYKIKDNYVESDSLPFDTYIDLFWNYKGESQKIGSLRNESKLSKITLTVKKYDDDETLRLLLTSESRTEGIYIIPLTDIIPFKNFYLKNIGGHHDPGSYSFKIIMKRKYYALEKNEYSEEKFRIALSDPEPYFCTYSLSDRLKKEGDTYNEYEYDERKITFKEWLTTLVNNSSKKLSSPDCAAAFIKDHPGSDKNGIHELFKKLLKELAADGILDSNRSPRYFKKQ